MDFYNDAFLRRKELKRQSGCLSDLSPATQRAPGLGVWAGERDWQGNGQLWLNVRVIGLNVIFILTPLKCQNTR